MRSLCSGCLCIVWILSRTTTWWSSISPTAFCSGLVLAGGDRCISWTSRPPYSSSQGHLPPSRAAISASDPFASLCRWYRPIWTPSPTELWVNFGHRLASSASGLWRRREGRHAAPCRPAHILLLPVLLYYYLPPLLLTTTYNITPNINI